MVIWICSPSAETYFTCLEKLIDQNHRWDCTDREGSWPESSPNHRPLPCDSESPSRLWTATTVKKKKKSFRKKSIVNKFVVTRCVWFQRKIIQIIRRFRKRQYSKTHVFQMPQEMENSSHAYGMPYRLVYSSMWLEPAGIFSFSTSIFLKKHKISAFSSMVILHRLQLCYRLTIFTSLACVAS